MTEAGGRSVIMLGAGGHARVLQECLAEIGVQLAGYIAPTASDSNLVDVAWLGDDAFLRTLRPDTVELVNGVGSVRSPRLRKQVFQSAQDSGFEFRNVIDPSAIVKASAQLGIGVQILTGSIIGTGVSLGDNVIVNTGAIVDHDSTVGDHSHISPGAVLAGGAEVGMVSHVGLGARVIQGIKVGSECTVGAGAVVIRDVPDRSVAIGIPATWRPVEQ